MPSENGRGPKSAVLGQHRGYLQTSSFLDTSNAVADRNAAQVCAAIEYVTAKAHDPVRNDDDRQAGAVSESSFSDLDNIVPNQHDTEAGATQECASTDVGDAVADHDVGKVCAAIESSFSDVDDAVWENDFCEAAAPKKGRKPNARNTPWNGVAAGLSRRVLEDGALVAVKQNPARTAVSRVKQVHRDVGEVGATTVKRNGRDVGYRRRNCDVGQVTTGERIVCKACDWQPVDGVWDSDIPAGAGVSGNGDGAVIGCVSVILGLHHGGQDQQEQQQKETGQSRSHALSLGWCCKQAWQGQG